MSGRGAALAARAARLMPDRCQVINETDGAPDRYGIPTPVVTVTSSACKVIDSSQDEAQPQSTQIALNRARVLLPRGTVVTGRASIRLTHRDGDALLAPLLYEVLGTPSTNGAYVEVQVQAKAESGVA